MWQLDSLSSKWDKWTVNEYLNVKCYCFGFIDQPVYNENVTFATNRSYRLTFFSQDSFNGSNSLTFFSSKFHKPTFKNYQKTNKT